MRLEERIEAFAKLGDMLRSMDRGEFQALATAAGNENSWFTPVSVSQAISEIVSMLDRKSLREWVLEYQFRETPKTVAVIMAGNIPLVGFHDLLSVLISGNKIMARPSSKDKVLTRFIIDKLIEIEPRFKEYIQVVEQLKGFDAVIATGSDNSSRYFNFYFGKYPNIIRKNRSSCAILSGFETEDELKELGKDVFTYFGLGCRNISKIYVPSGYEFDKMFQSWNVYENVLLHHKYHNNYDYQKSILLVNRENFLDNGFILLQESNKLVSPISVLYYETYNDWEDLLRKIKEQKDKIQCIVGNVPQASVQIGKAQSPKLDDYADQINTLKFLESL